MRSVIVLLCLISISFYGKSYSKGRSLSGQVPETNRIVDGVQYIAKDSAYLNLEEAPIVAEMDTRDHSITLYAPLIAPPDSLYISFVPGNLFTAQLQAIVEWDNQSGTYRYFYDIISDSSSVTPIWHFEIEWWDDYKQTYAPEGWSARSLHPTLHERRVNYWSSFSRNQIQKGDKLPGIGYQSYGPPVLTEFKLWGNSEILGQYGEDEMFGSIYSGISDKFRGVEGITIAAWVSPESIEPVDWFRRVSTSIPILKNSGYLDNRVQSEIYPSVYSLYETFRLKENQTIEILEQHINTALAALAPYQSQMQPEAWAFITENMKYVLRHLDIVTFKEYP